MVDYINRNTEHVILWHYRESGPKAKKKYRRFIIDKIDDIFYNMSGDQTKASMYLTQIYKELKGKETKQDE